jgi:hypothetical protein
MHLEAPHLSRRATRIRFIASVVLLCIAACSQSTDNKRGSQSSETRETPKSSDTQNPPPDKNSPRTELSIGYSLLYQEANGIPRLKWLLTYKHKSKEMARVTGDLIKYYQQLADTMRKLSKLYPAMRIDVAPMSEIEGNERKAMGEDMAKDVAPVAGKGGVAFEREALLMFYNSLDEERHLVGVMVPLETDPGLKQFLETTKAQLDAHYGKVKALLNRRYFTH